MPTRLMQVHEQSSGYKPVVPQPFDFFHHARPSEKNPLCVPTSSDVRFGNGAITPSYREVGRAKKG